MAWYYGAFIEGDVKVLGAVKYQTFIYLRITQAKPAVQLLNRVFLFTCIEKYFPSLQGINIRILKRLLRCLNALKLHKPIGPVPFCPLVEGKSEALNLAPPLQKSVNIIGVRFFIKSPYE